MEKENNNNKFILKFSRFFSSSCITQDISKVIDHKKPSFTPKTPLMGEAEPEHEHEEEDEDEENNLSSYPIIRPNKQQTQLLTCKPRCLESFDQMVRESCIIPAAGNLFPRRRRYSLLSPAGEFSGRRCPPVSPASPLFQRQREKKKKPKKKKQRTKNGGFGNKLEKAHFKNLNPLSFSSSNETDWFSSDDEREEEEDEEQHKTEHTMFRPSLSPKSISLSSDSDPETQNRVRNRRRKGNSGSGPSRVGRKREEMVEGVSLQRKTEHTLFHPSNKSIYPSSDSDPDRLNRVRNHRRRGNSGLGPSRVGRKREEMEDTFAVVKSSSDPYSDFRTSMVEMIIEKQIFGERELEQLLQCFLSLNASHHHRLIFEVFTEIWDALFSYRS